MKILDAVSGHALNGNVVDGIVSVFDILHVVARMCAMIEFIFVIGYVSGVPRRPKGQQQVNVRFCVEAICVGYNIRSSMQCIIVFFSHDQYGHVPSMFW